MELNIWMIKASELTCEGRMSKLGVFGLRMRWCRRDL